MVSRRIVVRSLSREARWLLLHSALLGLGATVLASCAAYEPPPPPQNVAVRPLPPHPAPPPSPSAAPRPARKPTAPPPSGSPPPAPDEQTLAMTAPKPTESAATPEATPQSPDAGTISTSPTRSAPIPSQSELIGLDQSAATRLFGTATEKSDEPPATVWRYKTASCELDLFFYLDLSSGHMRTLHYALKGGGADAARRQECLRSLTTVKDG